MPKTYITREQRNRAHFSAWLFGQMKVGHVTQAELARKLDCTQQALSRKLKTQHFTLNDMIVIFEVFKPDSRELDDLLGIDRHKEQ